MNYEKHLSILCFLIIGSILTGQFAEGEAHKKAFSKISDALSSLGTKLLADIHAHSSSHENVFISPINIFHAMLMLHLGAGGNTLKELSAALGIPMHRNYSKEIIHATSGRYFENIESSKESSVIIQLADGLFVQNGFRIKESYYDQIRKFYHSDVRHLDFGLKKEAAREINSWVAEKTNNRFQNVVNEDEFANPIEAMLITSIYFSGRWASSFPTYTTKKEKFFTGKDEIVVPTMNLIENLPYVNNSEFQFESIDLNYDESDYYMNVILPYRTQTVKNLTQFLKDVKISELMANSSSTGVDLKLPKMKFSKQISLVEPWQRIGVRDIFDVANLSDLSETTIRVSKVVHAAEIEIDEKGTVATAVTIVHIAPVSMPLPIFNPVPFHVNRPFIINIYHRTIGMVLFSGIVHQPLSSD